MVARRCGGCGAELELRSEPCPLCGGTSVALRERAPKPVDVAAYQSNVRDLRDQLRKLREGAEAV
jgi:hypothetical protein